MADEDIVREEVLAFLRTADMETTTERVVIKHVDQVLGSRLSAPAASFKSVISSVIDQFLAQLDGEEGSDGGDPEAEEEEPRGGKKRGAGAGAAGAAGKKARQGGGAAAAAADDSILSVDLGGPRRKVRVRRFNGKLQVDVREFYESNGVQQPGAKGLAMDPDAWHRLADRLPALLAAQREGRTDEEPVALTAARLASISEFRGTYYLGLREHYEKDGQMLPGKKGINLDLAAAEALLAAAPQVSAALGVPHGEAPPPVPAAPAPARPAPAADRAAPAGGHGAGGAAAAGGGGGGGGDEECVELGGMKRLSLSRYGGRLSVDLREFYDAGGVAKPGKKGIALSPADWGTLAAHAHDISAALARRDTGYCLQLSGKRKVVVSNFKNVLYVNVREYYDKDGQELPGAKGLSMNPTQWAACAGAVPAMSAALERAGRG